MKHKIIEFPTAWEEVKPEEFTYLVNLFFKMIHRRGVELMDVKREWIRFVLRNRSVKPNNSLQYYKLIHDLLPMLDWLFIEEGNKAGINFTSTVNLMPHYGHLYGPADHGADLTFGEYRTAVQLMNAYSTEHSDEFIAALAGMLYRKKRNGTRETFDIEQMTAYERRGRKMPQYVQYSVYLWLASFSKFLMEGTFVVDGSEVCFGDLFERNGGEPKKNLGMNGILYSMAESGVFGTADDVDRTPLLKVLMKLMNDKYKLDELKERMKERKKQ